MVEGTFREVWKVWPMLTRVDHSWPSLTKIMSIPKSRFDRPLEEYIKTFDLILHGSKMDEKRGSYGQNRKNWPESWLNLAKYYWPKQAHPRDDVRAQSLLNTLQIGPQVWNFKKEGKFSYDVQLSNRQELLQLGRNLDWQMTPHHENHSSGLCSQGCSSQAQTQLLTIFVTLRRKHHELSRDTKIIKNWHWELGQPCAGKLTKVRKWYAICIVQIEQKKVLYRRCVSTMLLNRMIHAYHINSIVYYKSDVT